MTHKHLTKPTKVTITTDGGCQNYGSKIGAWAAILRFGEHVKTVSGVESGTTNNRMELTAIIQALRALNRPCSVTLRTDSKYCIFAIRAKFTPKSRARWSREKTPNRDLAAGLWLAMEGHKINCVWVKGHTGDPDNETADKLCSATIKQTRSQLTLAQG